jgi:soluble lytic murein transglycosylase-like protein
LKFVLKLGIGLLAIAPFAQAAELAQLANGFSIRHERREVIGGTTRLYLSGDSSYVDIPTAQIKKFEPDLSVTDVTEKVAPERSPVADVHQVVRDAATKHRIDPDFLSSVIQAESGFNVRAVSKKGAQGLMQLMPKTAAELGVNDSFNPTLNVDAGSRYLRDLFARYNYDAVKALAAYNAGPHRVEQYKGVPPYRETRAYVAKIINDYNKKKRAQRATSTSTKKSASGGPAATP